jgi:hypothetical protein
MRVRFVTFESKAHATRQCRRPAPQRRCHLRRGGAGQPARLQNQNLLAFGPWLVEQDERNARGLAGTGRRHQHRGIVAGERGGQIRKRVVNGKGRVKGLHLSAPSPRAGLRENRLQRVVQ